MAIALPVCRHRGQRVSANSWKCHSPKVVVANGIATTAQCARECPAIDHDPDPRFQRAAFGCGDPVSPMIVGRNVVREVIRVRPRPERIAIAMITAPRSRSTLRESLREVRRAGFPQVIHLFAEPGTDVDDLPGDVQVFRNETTLGCWGNWRRAADFLLHERSEPFLLILEDDLWLTRGAALALEHAIDTEPHDAWGIASLYTPRHNVEGQPPAEGWQPLSLGSRAWGSLAYCLSRESCADVLRYAPPQRTTAEIHTDNFVNAAALMTGRRCLYHVPSLCEHAGGDVSTLGHGYTPLSDGVRFSHEHCGYEPDLRCSLPGKLAVITTHFNPCDYEALRRNYRIFSEKVLEAGADLWTVEVALGDAEFRLMPGPRVLQLRSDSVLWHKEQSLNAILRRLPADYDKVAWIDADIVFLRTDWPDAIGRALEERPIVQCFSEALCCDPSGRPEYWMESIVKRCQDDPYFPFERGGAIGYAWAARRDLLDEVGLFGEDMAGSGDTYMLSAWLGRRDHPVMSRIAPHLAAALDRWEDRCWPRVFGQIGWVEGTVHHLYHGHFAGRSYLERVDFLRMHDFDPRSHLELDGNGLYRWSPIGRSLEEQMIAYFRLRQEDEVGAGSVSPSPERPQPQNLSRVAPRVVVDCLQRAQILLPPHTFRSKRCIATVATPGFEDWLDRMLGSLLRNGRCDDALRIVFVLEQDEATRRVAERHGAIPVPCRPYAGCDSSIKSLLYSMTRVVDAEQFLSLDADLVVLDDVAKMFAQIERNPGRVLIVRDAQYDTDPDRSLGGLMRRFYQATPADLEELLPGAARHAENEFAVNDGVFAGDRCALADIDRRLRNMSQAPDFVDEFPVRNQLLFNLALLESGRALELEPIYNVQLHADSVESRTTPEGIRIFRKGQPVRILHFTGNSKHHSPMRHWFDPKGREQ